MTAVAAFKAIAMVVVSFPSPIAAGPSTGVAFNNVVPNPVMAAAFAVTIFVAVPVTAGTSCNLEFSIYKNCVKNGIFQSEKMSTKFTFAAAPETTALAADAATVLTADDTTDEAAPATAGMAALAALALAEANK